MKPNVQINLSAAEAEVIHTALAHTRWAYLGMTERGVVNRIVEGLLPYRRPECGQNKHYEAKRIAAQQTPEQKETHIYIIN